MSGSIYTSVFGTGTPSAPVPSVSGLDETAGAAVVTVKANTALAESTTDATTTVLALDTRNTVAAVAAVAVNGPPPTIVSATGVTYSQLKAKTITVTLTGTTTVTALDGLGTYLDVPTVTDASAVTVTTISNLYVALPVAAGSVTGTNIYTAHFAGAVLVDGNIVVNSAAATIKAKANTAATLAISDGTTNILTVDSRNTVTGVAAFTVTASAPTIAGASGTTFSAAKIAATTITDSTQTTITALEGMGLYIDIPTVNQSGGAVTVTTLSNLYVALPVAGASVTGANIFAAHFAGGIKVDGNFDLTAGASTEKLKSNTAAASIINDGTTSYYTIDTRNTVTGVTANLFGAAAPTIAGASGTTYSQVGIGAITLTTSTTTTITALNGVALNIATPTIAQSGGAVTVTTASTVYIQKPAAGGSVTLTNTRIIDTDVAGCFCTSAGTWTSVSSRAAKKNIAPLQLDQMPDLIDQVEVVTFNKVSTDDGEAMRFGVIAEETPDFLAMPGRQGVAAVYLSGFALAAIKYLKETCEKLQARVEQLERGAA